MKKILFPFLFSCLLVVVSCKDEPACCDHLADFPDIQVLDEETEEDLLNPDNEGTFDTSEISLSAQTGNGLENLLIEINYVEELNNHHIISKDSKMIEFLSVEGNRDYYLSLNENTVDTITLVINSSIRTEKVLINGAETELNNNLLTIYK